MTTPEVEVPADFTNVSQLKLAGKEFATASEVHIRPATSPGDLWVMVHAGTQPDNPADASGTGLSFLTSDGTEVEVVNSELLHSDSHGHYLLKATSPDGTSPLRARKLKRG
jgi:hypothetical protein